MRAVVAGVVASVVMATAIVGPNGRVRTSHAQQAEPDVTRAKELYLAAETAMAENRFADAARDYGGAYEITKDPVLFFKLGSAHERAGKCEVALVYYRRYLGEAKPSDTFVVLTKERITACGGQPASQPVVPKDPAVDPVGAGSGSAVVGDPGAGSSAVVPDPGLGAVVAPPVAAPRGKHRLAWILVGGSIASLTVGVVLAYSANAAESDVTDLYVGLSGTPPVFNSSTQARFDALIDEGERYQTLAWVSFGIAGALAIGAAIRFATAKDDEPLDTKKTVRITPTVSPQGAGVSAVVRF